MDVEGLTAKLQQGRQASSGTQTPAIISNGSAIGNEGQTGAEKEKGISNGFSTREEPEDKLNSKNDPNSSKQDKENSIISEDRKDMIAPAEERAESSDAPSEKNPNDAMERAWKDAVPQTGLSGLDSVAEPSPRPIAAEARLTPSPQPSTPVLVEQEDSATRPPSDSVTISLNEEMQESKASHKGASKKTEGSQTVSLNDKSAKLALWNELKIASISRSITTLYGIVLLSLQTRIQLNLLGRYAYLTSVSSMSTSDDFAKHQIRIERNDGYDDLDDDREEDREDNLQNTNANADVLTNGIDMQTERLYLTLSWWFLHRGWQELADLVRSAVEEVFGGIPLKAQLSHAEFVSMIQKVRRRIEYETHCTDGQNQLTTSFASVDVRSEYSEATTTLTSRRRRGKRRDFSTILFPPQGQELQVLIDAGALPQSSKINTVSDLQSLSNTLPALLDETRDIVESNDFWRVLKLGLRESFDVLEHKLRPSFGLKALHTPHPPPSEAQITELAPSTDPSHLAKMNGSIQDSDQEGKSIRLASLFPAIARQSSAAIHGFPNEYMDALNNVKELRAFCAVIYSSWS